MEPGRWEAGRVTVRPSPASPPGDSKASHTAKRVAAQPTGSHHQLCLIASSVDILTQ